MPGPYIHMSAMRHALEGLSSGDYRPLESRRINPGWEGENIAELGNLLSKHPNFANLGAVGPDLFFFLPDFRDVNGIELSSVLVKVLLFLEKAFEALDPYIEKYERYLGPINENLAEEMSRLTGGLSESVGNIVSELSEILITLLEDFVTEQRDWWSFFSLGLNKGYDEQAYFWSDMLHYRKTGRFGKALWQNAIATEDDGAKAYALGYLTHLATDVTGHALVNAISGGPFRQHWQRHHLVENHMDAYWYLLDPGTQAPRNFGNYSQMTESALYYDIAFKESSNESVPRPSIPTGQTLREKWVRKRRLDIDSELPDPIADILIQSMLDVFYQNGKHPKILRDNDGRPSKELIEEAYRLFFRFLKITTVDGFSHEPPPPPDVFPNLDFPAFSDPGSNSAPGDDDDDGNFWDDLLDFILSVIRAIAYVAEVAIYLATLPWAVLADILTYPLRLGLYYALELPLFHLLKMFRSALVMTGYLMPMKDEIVQPLIRVGNTEGSAWQDVVDDINDIFGGTLSGQPGEGRETFRDPKYPYLHQDDDFKHPWQYPKGGSELPLTTAGPYARSSSPSVLFRTVRENAEIRDDLETSLTPDDTDKIGRRLTPSRHLGDAVSFSQYLIWLASRSDPNAQIADWNLDSDRGYGYRCWDWNRNPLSDRFPGERDDEGNIFAQPCTCPSQAGQCWNPFVPLKLHWDEVADPGCDTEIPPIG